MTTPRHVSRSSGQGRRASPPRQVLLARGVEVDVFEIGSEVGGNWRYDNDNGLSSAYRSLHINTSRRLMEYAAYPMPAAPARLPEPLADRAILRRLRGPLRLRDRIRFRTEVVKVAPACRGVRRHRPQPQRARRDQRARDAALRERRSSPTATTGTRAGPSRPSPAARPSPAPRSTRTTTRRPRRSRADACWCWGSATPRPTSRWSASRVAERTYLAMRRGAHIVPKFMFGMPTDHLTGSVVARAPTAVQQVAMGAMLRLTQGRVTDYGLPRPDHRVLHAHPTVSDDLLTRLGHGDLTVLPDIDRFEGSKVFFVDGSAHEVDAVVYCTGYKVTFPFLDERVVRAADNHVDLYRRVVDPDNPGLFFVGLIQPLGAVMPLAEAQAEWVADLLTGEAALPSYDEMRRQIRRYDEALRRRYVNSKRHTLQVDFHKYRAEIARERRAGRARLAAGADRRQLGVGAAASACRGSPTKLTTPPRPAARCTPASPARSPRRTPPAGHSRRRPDPTRPGSAATASSEPGAGDGVVDAARHAGVAVRGRRQHARGQRSDQGDQAEGEQGERRAARAADSCCPRPRRQPERAGAAEHRSHRHLQRAARSGRRARPTGTRAAPARSSSAASPAPPARARSRPRPAAGAPGRTTSPRARRRPAASSRWRR